jgi:hypothetical protein
LRARARFLAPEQRQGLKLALLDDVKTNVGKTKANNASWVKLFEEVELPSYPNTCSMSADKMIEELKQQT